MPNLYTANEVHCHVRSISLPSRPHPTSHKIETELQKLKLASADTPKSSQTETIKVSLSGLAELYNSVEELIGSPQTQQALLRQSHQHEQKHAEKALDMSLGLLDVCESARELLLMMKQQIQDLQSALRRKGSDSSIKSHISAYISFRKNAKKEISKSLKLLKTMESSFKAYPLSDENHHLSMVIKVLAELNVLSILFFKKLLLFVYAPELKKNSGGWSLISRIVSNGSDREKTIINEIEGIDITIYSFYKSVRKTDAKAESQNVKRRLEEVDVSIKGLEARLDCLFKCLIQHRVSLLNLFTA